ncbi:hypothetical protein DM01DRAFT_1336802 [Hesseltinella vesiculosa]|uniref:Uncharacterized protein n=1 Tax=Hesseltinella vesiculosa TaxID=101127 RepID=A0A1X2GFA5_9FUNG|nr:hypothetical protein DM01DRAFT_1336802 [Hesseltinella vesiculosa]
MPTTEYDLGYENPAIFKIYDFMGASDSQSASPSLAFEEHPFVNIDYQQSRKDQRMLSAMQRCKIWICVYQLKMSYTNTAKCVNASRSSYHKYARMFDGNPPYDLLEQFGVAAMAEITALQPIPQPPRMDPALPHLF